MTKEGWCHYETKSYRILVRATQYHTVVAWVASKEVRAAMVEEAQEQPLVAMAEMLETAEQHMPPGGRAALCLSHLIERKCALLGDDSGNERSCKSRLLFILKNTDRKETYPVQKCAKISLFADCRAAKPFVR